MQLFLYGVLCDLFNRINITGDISYVLNNLANLNNFVSFSKFQLNETKCKEMRICFSTKGSLELDPIVINDKQIDIVSHAKILGVNVSSDLKWNHHIAEIVKKAGKRLF